MAIKSRVLTSAAIAIAIAIVLLPSASAQVGGPVSNTGNSSSGTDADGTAFVVESVPGTAASATGTDAIGIGDGAVAGNAIGDTSAISIGVGSSALALRSIALGDSAQATTDRAMAWGQNTDATGVNCIAIGGNFVDEDSADCSGASSVALGQRILADDPGEFAYASGEFAAQSDAHTSIFVLRNSTTDATQTELFADGSAGDISVPSDCTVAFDALITARQTDADNVSAGYTFFGVIDNNAGTTALVGSLGTVTTIGEDVAGWDVTATADDTNDGINILVTGAVGDAVQWVARVEVVETCG